MFYHDISPFILRISGEFGVRWYSLAYILGFIAAYWWLSHLAKKKIIKNLDAKAVDSFIIYLIVGLIVGARFFHVFVFEPAYYFAHPLDILKIWQGGLSFHGGLAGSIVAALLFCRKHKVRFFALADAVSIITGVFLALGRMANFINGELYGRMTSVSWCVDYSKNQYIYNPPQGCRHPSQLYEVVYSLFIFGVLSVTYAKDKSKRLFGTGFFFWLFITMYGFLRFLVTFYRDEPSVLGLGFSESQLFSLLMFIVGVIFLARTWGKSRRK